MKEIQFQIGDEIKTKFVAETIKSYRIIIEEREVVYKDTGKIENSKCIFEPIINNIEQSYSEGKTIQYKSEDVDHWTDFEPQSETDRPSFSNRLQWRVK